MKKGDLKIQLIFSLLMMLLIDILLTIIWFLGGIDTTTYIVIIVAIFVWPISVFITSKQLKDNYFDDSNEYRRAPVKLSIIGWLVLSSILFLYNYLIGGSLTWVFYPVAGITLWPVGMILYNYLYKKIT